MANKTIAALAQKHGKSAAQIMIRWCLEKGFITIPKSTHADRIKENFDALSFKFDAEDLTQIAGLDKGLRTCWDPTHVA